jgi:hypothetical protein
MKTKQILTSIFTSSVVVALLAMSSCSSDNSKNSAHQTHGSDSTGQAQSPAVAVSLEDQNANAVYQHYIHLKNALVTGDTKEAQSGASSLQTAFNDAGNNKGADLAGKVASVSDLKMQRAQLEELTAEAENVIKTSKVKTGTIYKQYCPMANNNEGAYWLSGESEIRNPYFGDEMLTCGEVKEEIK